MITMWIGGEPYAPSNRGRLPVTNPMSRQIEDELVVANLDDVDQAMANASAAGQTWRHTCADDREQTFFRAASQLESEVDTLAPLVTAESGSTLAKSRHEILYAAKLLRAAAGEARRLYGETMPDDREGRFSLVVREPLGVIGVISPFNAPVALFVKMLAFPLAAGNTIVAKPSELTPRSASEVVRILSNAGLPAGALNLLHGPGEVVGLGIAQHQSLSGLCFTGSSAVGQKLGAILGGRLKAQHLELGGNNPLIILPDFPMEQAVEMALHGSFFHAGQICMASSRLIVDASVYEEFRECFKQRAENLFLGDLHDQRTFYGPLIHQHALNQTQRVVDNARAAGARLLTGGQAQTGWRYLPTIFENVPCATPLWREETFAPVVSLAKFTNLDQAIALANDSAYGLSAGLLTHDYQKGLFLAKRVHTGAVHIGNHPFQSSTMFPVGGHGLSGIGKSGGHYSVEHFTHCRWLSFSL